ncbi:MAG: hypothetical protein ABI566_02435 [Pseudolysinimonas sp.]
MTTRPWFRPVLGLVIALAVGVAAVFIGFQFAPKQQIVETPTAIAAPETITAPIVQPVAFGEDTPPADAVDGVFEVGDATGTYEVPIPDDTTSDGAATVEAYAEAEAHADDAIRPTLPGWEVIPYLPELHLFDPCSPPLGTEPADDCPPGVTGLILPIIDIADFGTVVWIDPPTSDEVAAGDDSTHGRSCDFAEDGVHALVLETVPADLDVVTLQAVSTSAGIVYTFANSAHIEVSDEQRTAYEDSLDAAADFFDVAFPTWCLTIDSDDLPDGSYAVEAHGSDDTGRDADAVAGTFTLPLPAPVHPEIQVRTIGESLVLASAIHSPDETITMKVQAGPGTLPSTACENDGTVDLEPLTTAEADVDPAYLVSIHAPADYTRKTVNAYRVPEGSTIVFCARWWPGGDAPSWQESQWTYTSFIDVHSPDRIMPTVKLEAVTPADPGLRGLYINGSTMEGIQCDSQAAWALGNDVDADHDDICRSSDGVEGTAYTYGDGYLRDDGFSGDLALQVVANYDSGEDTQNWVFLNLSRNMCFGTCRLPRSQHYFLPVGALESGSCGVFTGLDCQPVDTTRAGGAVMVKVSWAQGNQNGLERFRTGTALGTAQMYEPADRAQVDTNLGWRNLRVDPTTLLYGGYLDVAVDRDATVIPRLVRPADGLVAPGGCANPTGGAPGEPVTMLAGVQQSIRYEGLTAGCSYQVELTVLEGDATVGGMWGIFAGADFWANARVDVPLIPVTLEAIVVFNEQHAHVRRLEMQLGGFDLGLPEGGCTISDGSYVSVQTFATSLPAELPLTGVADIRVEPPCNDLAPRTVGPSAFSLPGFTLRQLLEADIESGRSVFTNIDVNGERITILLDARLRG